MGLRDDDVEFATYGNRWARLMGHPRALAFDKALVQWTGFSAISFVSARQGGRPYTPVLLLTTIGVKSGALRTKALPYVSDGDRFILVASFGGGPRNPHWVANVVANSICWVRVNRRNLPARAHVARPDERAALWERVVRAKPNVARYQERASTYGRDIPFVVVETRDRDG